MFGKSWKKGKPLKKRALFLKKYNHHHASFSNGNRKQMLR